MRTIEVILEIVGIVALVVTPVYTIRQLMRAPPRRHQHIVMDDPGVDLNKNLYNQLDIIRNARFGGFRSPAPPVQKDKNE
jgi:hypothetical protein